MSILDAATVVLFRPAGETFEVLFVERNRGMSFMGGAHVFPGGKLDPSDIELAADLPTDHREAWATRIEPTPGRPVPTPPAALAIAACRELVEEAGVVLGTLASDSDVVDWVDRYRAKQCSFDQLWLGLGCELPRAGLHYFDHWVTPSFERRRFDARFFWCQSPSGQVAREDADESTSCEWMTPDVALERHRNGEIRLPVPTLKAVLDFSKARTLDALPKRASIAAILPKVVGGDNQIEIILPWDSRYDAAEGESLDIQDHPMREACTHFVLCDGILRAEVG